MPLVEELRQRWLTLSGREQVVLGCGGLLVLIILMYQFLYRPAHIAKATMQNNIGDLRSNLVWLREQVEHGVEGGGQTSTVNNAGEGQSLVAVLESVARANNLEGSIQQLTPGDSDNQVRLVLDNASFNSWVKWVSELEQKYGVIVESATVERLSNPDTAEIRMQLRRN